MSTSIVVAYPFTPEALNERVDSLRGQSFATPALYKEGVKAIAVCRDMRVQIEERRKLLKQDSLEYGRKVDAVAKQLVDIIESVEKPLKASKLDVDEAKERAKREAAEAERRAVEERIRAEREAEEAALKAKRDEEQAQLIQQRLELELERKAAAAERAALQADRDAAAKELAEIRARKAAEQRAREAQELADRMAAEAEEARINALEHAEAQKRRLAALAPDMEKLQRVSAAIRKLAASFADMPTADPWAGRQIDLAVESLSNAASAIDEWLEEKQK